MKIIADKHIPYIKGALEHFGKVEYIAGRDFDYSNVQDADILVVRTVTPINKELLHGSSVKLVCSATIGFDHIDVDYCRNNNIAWVTAPGCNANSVKQYVTSALLRFSFDKGMPLRGKTIGVVGVGHVGRKIVEASERLGMNVLQCDPLRQQQEKDNLLFCSMETIAQQADIITFHTPLTNKGLYPTYHLADKSFFAKLKRRPLIINTARGEVVETEALKMALKKGLVSSCIIDCWENEPIIDRELLEQAFIATPHIAGYSADGKAQASQMVLKEIALFCKKEKEQLPVIKIPAPSSTIIDLEIFTSYRAEQALLTTYAIEDDSQKLKNNPEKFSFFREHYPLRRELKAYQIVNASKEEQDFLSGWR